MFSDPRILIVRCKALKIDFYIISAHAPYVKSPTYFKDACEWWVQLSKVVSDTCVQGIPVLAGIDGNYTVHGDASTGVGDVYRPGEPPPQHSSVCDFLNNFNSLFLIHSRIICSMNFLEVSHRISLSKGLSLMRHVLITLWVHIM